MTDKSLEGTELLSESSIICIWCGEGTDFSCGLVVCGDVHICDACVEKTRDDELLGDIALIRSMVESPTNEKHYKRIEELLRKYPKDPNWARHLSPDRKLGIERIERLALQWLHLNVNNPKLNFRSHLSPESSPAFLSAALKWMQKGGKASKRMPPVIADVVRAVTGCHEPIRPLILDFARRWVKNNPSHAYADQVYSAILTATHSHYDIRKAKKWYSTHKQHECAWHVIAAILEIAYWDSSEPDSYAVEEATSLLKKEERRAEMPRLVGGLVSVWPNEQNIGWAKETYQRTGLVWILTRLLWRAPDRSLIAQAEAAYDQWIDTILEAEMLYALLRADPSNKCARTRSQVFFQTNPNHPFCTAIKLAMEGKA